LDPSLSKLKGLHCTDGETEALRSVFPSEKRRGVVPRETVVWGLPNLAAQWNPLGLFKKYNAWAPHPNILI